MDISFNLKRRRDREDLVTEGEGKNIKNNNNNAPTRERTTIQATTTRKKSKKKKTTPSPTYSTPTTKKCTKSTNQNLPLPNITFSFTHCNSQDTIPVSPKESTPSSSSSSSISTKKRTKSASSEVRQPINGYYFCADTIELPSIDHDLKKTLNHLITLKTIDHKDITNPYLFRGASMVTTFVRSDGNGTKELWRFIEEASRTEMEQPSFNVMSTKCAGRVPIYVHLSLYWYPRDVGGISWDGRVTTELGTGSFVRPSASSPRRISGP